MKRKTEYSGTEIAIIGIACRFPGASDHESYFDNLLNGRCSVQSVSDEELIRSGLTAEFISNPDFVKTRNPLQDKDCFDAAFFDYRPAEARLMNPEIRLFHECAWQALEDAGYNPETFEGPIGLYAAGDDDLYWRIFAHLSNRNDVDEFTLNQLSNKDFLTTLVAYKLNLRGPSISIHTACSSSLVAVHAACRSLLLGESKMALAGGTSVIHSKQNGYRYQTGGVMSADGYCRAFDAKASGTCDGEGTGIVVLKRLRDAIADKDHVYAVIKGSAVNNDGNRKPGFASPGISGQAECIRMAQLVAKTPPSSISYIETHGTGTVLGDPIEIEALNLAFENNTAHRCAIGSVKTNIGHLNAAAGIASLIKTALALKYKKIPPSLHYQSPNPQINFQNGPFYVNDKLIDWPTSDEEPRRAGVSSFGIGGTNAHVILEEAAETKPDLPENEINLLCISAKSKSALLRISDAIADMLEQAPQISLSDMAWTFHHGRKSFTNRKAFAFSGKQELVQKLKTEKRAGISSSEKIKPVFLFPGQGSLYLNMGRDLYFTERRFREIMDEGFAILKKITGADFKKYIFPENGQESGEISETRIAQPLTFLAGYALAQQLIALGINPVCSIGHSSGEYTAACLSGVLSFENTLRLLVQRGELMNGLPAGIMLSANIGSDDARQFLSGSISIAAVNAPEQVVFSGPDSEIQLLENKLKAADISSLRLNNTRAFHSGMMDPILADFKSAFEKTECGEIKIPFISCLSGNWITGEESVSAEYWCSQLRNTVAFSEGVRTILREYSDVLFIELGGPALGKLVIQSSGKDNTVKTVSMFPHATANENGQKFFKEKTGLLWEYGIQINWKAFYRNEKRNRLSLPVYSFEKTRFPSEIDFTNLSALIAGGLQPATAITDLNWIPKSNEYADEENQPVMEFRERPQTIAEYSPPQTETEIRLAGLATDFFGIGRIGRDDNFFDLGGDSLKALVFLRKAEQQWGWRIPLSDFFEAPSIRLLALRIDSPAGAGTDDEKKYIEII